MFREIGKSLRILWSSIITLGAVIGSMMGTFDGTWFGDWFMPAASLLFFVWLALFAIGVSRGEPNP